MFTLNEKPPAFASRAIGILEGVLALDPAAGPAAIRIITEDGAEIRGSVQRRAIAKVLEDPTVLGRRSRFLVYPRTERNLLKVQVIDIEPAPQRSPEADHFLVQGWNLGTRKANQAQIGIRPNKKSKHQFERFWISLYGHLKEDLKCVYQVKAIRRGSRLYIIASDPQLPKECSPHREKSQPRTSRSLIRR